MVGNLVQRVAVAAVGIPVAIAVVWLGGYPLVLLLAIVAALGTFELLNLAVRQGVNPVSGFAFLLAGALPALTYGALTSPAVRASVQGLWPYALALWSIGLLTWVLGARSPTEKPLASVAVTCFAPLYCAALPSFLLAIRLGPSDQSPWAATWLTFLPLAVIWLCDTAAMFAGKAFGGRKLAPVISPGKTWSGAIAGFFGGTVGAVLFGGLALRPVGVVLPLWQLVAFGAVVSTAGQIGDLAESLLKREAGVKDSSHLIPGHGGVLDRFDALYFGIPVAAVLFRCFEVI